MHTSVLIVLVVCISLCLLLFFYPLFVITFSIFRRRKIKISKDYISPVSIIIACYNEEQFIREKILSFIAKEEWIEGSELIVVSGGSTDNTNLLLEEFRGRKDIHLQIFDERIGKISSVNLAVSKSKNEILVFSDCRQKMKTGSVKSLIANFSDPEIGTVSSTLIDNEKLNGSTLVRTILNSIAFNECNAGSSLNLFGALYAQRKSVYRLIPEDILFDDLFVTISTLIQHKRLVQEKNAVIFDMRFDRYYTKERIERLTRGLLVFLFKYKNRITKLSPDQFVRFMIYKYLKLILPFLFITILFSTFYLIFPLILTIYSLVPLALILLLLIIKKSREFLFLFIRINWYFLTATLKFIFLKKRSITWQKIQTKSV